MGGQGERRPKHHTINPFSRPIFIHGEEYTELILGSTLVHVWLGFPHSHALRGQNQTCAQIRINSTVKDFQADLVNKQNDAKEQSI